MSALLVDYAGVLTEPLPDVYARFAELEAIEVDVLQTALRSLSAAIERFEVGALAEAEMEALLAARLAQAAGRAVRKRGLLSRFASCFTRDEAVWELLRDARATGARLCLITNSWLRETYPEDVELAELFDVVLMSREIGLRKPDARMFALAMQRLDVGADDCVFIDDAAENVAAARALGMRAVLYTGSAELLETMP